MNPLETSDRSGRTLDSQGHLMQQIRTFRVLATLAVAGCSSSTPVTPPPPPPPTTVDHVVLDNGAFTLNVGTTRQLQARALSASGNLLTDAVISYNSSTQTTATVNGTGLVTAVAPGTTTITASSSGKSATLVVTVQLVPVATFTVTLIRQTIKTNDTTRVIATLRDADNNPLINRAILWQSSDSSVALVGPSGIILGLNPGGPVTISGSVDGKTASVTLLVTPATVGSVMIVPDSAILTPGTTQQFNVIVTDEFGGVVSNPEVAWASVGGSNGSVSPTGMVTAVSVGDLLLLATVGGVTAQSLVRISLPELAKFRISVNNHLIYPVAITQNDVVVGQASPNAITVVERPMTDHAVFGWALVRPGGMGEPMYDALPVINNPTGTVSMNVTNVLSDGRVFFAPVLRSLNGAKNPIDFPQVWAALPCHCAISSADLVSRAYGYWQSFPNSTMKVFNEFNPSIFFTVAIPAVQIEAITGIWRYNLLIAP